MNELHHWFAEARREVEELTSRAAAWATVATWFNYLIFVAGTLLSIYGKFHEVREKESKPKPEPITELAPPRP